MKVIECFEVWKGDGDDCIFDHYSVVLTRGTEVLRAQSQSPFALHQELDTSELGCPLVRIPTVDLWPPLMDGITLAPYPVPDGTFQKKPLLATTPSSIVKPCELLLHEAQICEILKQYPHKNIASYLGCISDGGLIKSLCFVRYEETLSDRLRDPDRPLNLSECLKGVEDGLNHLHSLGLNHNDINPQNIMLNKQDVSVIIDFGSCEWDGGIPLGAGTPGWTDGDARITRSERKNDDFGLKQLQTKPWKEWDVQL